MQINLQMSNDFFVQCQKIVNNAQSQFPTVQPPVQKPKDIQFTIIKDLWKPANIHIWETGIADFLRAFFV